MILTCPQCTTQYQMDDDKFPSGGRKVRCAKCGHVWFQETAIAAPEPALDSLSQPEPPPPLPPLAPPPPQPPHLDGLRRAALSPPPPRPSTGPRGEAPPPSAARERSQFIAGLIVLAAVVGLIIWGGVRYRDEIANAWPQSSPLYAALGMPVHLRGLTFTDVNYSRDTASGRLVLTVEGSLVNSSSRELDVPDIEVILRDGERRQVDRWVFSPGAGRLRPGERVAFATHRTNPPEDARHLEMALAPAGG